MFNWIDKKTQLLTSKGLYGCPRRLRPPALKLFCIQSPLGKIDKEEPWTLEIISYWSDKLSSTLDYFTFDPRKKYFTNSAQKSGVICLSRPRIPARLRVPKSSRTTSPSPHVPTSPRPTLSNTTKYSTKYNKIIIAGEPTLLHITNTICNEN